VRHEAVAERPRVAREFRREAIRRVDWGRLLVRIAPVRFEPAGIPAVRPEDETDGAFASAVWDRAAAGTPANECEMEVKTDPFRVRRLYAAWVESRALRPRAS
jgi:hypothetical protein